VRVNRDGPPGRRAHTLDRVLALLLVAGSLGMSNFAASIAIGLSGVNPALRARIALSFGLFEAGMPVIGLLLGRQLSHTLGSQAHLVGGGLLVAAGAYTLLDAIRSGDDGPPVAGAGMGRLLLLGAGLSIDNLIVGFALGTYHAPLVLGIALIAIVSVGLSLIGLELGARLGTSVEHASELLGGIVLICVGAAIATQLI
jgi:manganese efflux pump family protein